MATKIEFQLWDEGGGRPLDYTLNNEEIRSDNGAIPAPGDLVVFTDPFGNGAYRVRSRYFAYAGTDGENPLLFVNIVVEEVSSEEHDKYIKS